MSALSRLHRLVSRWLCLGWLALWVPSAWAQTNQVHDIPTRDGVTQRVLWVQAPAAKGVMVVMPGGHGGMQITDRGGIPWGETIFFVRNREALARQGVHVIVVDAPSDKLKPPYLDGHRQRPDHVTDLRAVIRWAREQTRLPVWLVGFSRGTHSAAYYALQTGQSDDAPDAVVLAASILSDKPPTRTVPDKPLERIRVPVLWVHHEQDNCQYCPFPMLKLAMDKAVNAPVQGLLSYSGGTDHPDTCGPLGFHGFRQLEDKVEKDTIAWLLANAPRRQKGA